MDKHNICAKTLRAFLLSSALVPTCVSAEYPFIPLTPLEQMSALSSAASPAIVYKLARTRPHTIEARLRIQREDQAKWVLASPNERNAIARKIGEEGVARFSEERGWKTLLRPQGRSIPTGPDSAYWAPKSGRVYVLEAKGGSSQLNWSYSSLQGTNTNTIRSAGGFNAAGGFLRRSKTNRMEKLQMARLIKAAQKGHLVTGVVKTAHELGKPSDPRQVGSWNTDKIAKEARKMERELVRQHPELRKLFRMANFVHNVDSLKYYGASRLSEVGSAATRSLGLSATQQAGLQRIGRAGARWLPPLAVGVAGVTIVTSYHQFASGLMKPREFYRMGAGPTILVVFTATGAMVGVVAGGVGAVPGASLGAIVAVPVEVATNWVINRYYGDFDLGQRRLVDAAVEEFYGVVVALVDES